MKFYRVKWECDQKPFPKRKRNGSYMSNELFTQKEFEKWNVNPEYVEEVRFLERDTDISSGARFSNILELPRLRQFINTFRLKIWRRVRNNIDDGEFGNYICIALRTITYKMLSEYNEFELADFVIKCHSEAIVEDYFPEFVKMEKKATVPEEEKICVGWFGRLSPESKKIRLSVMDEIINQLKSKK